MKDEKRIPKTRDEKRGKEKRETENERQKIRDGRRETDKRRETAKRRETDALLTVPNTASRVIFSLSVPSSGYFMITSTALLCASL